jgi:peptide chain release factor 2
MAETGFWDRVEEVRKTIGRLKQIKPIVDSWKSCHRELHELNEYIQLLGEQDRESFAEIEKEVAKLVHQVETLDFKRLMSDAVDPNNAIVSINAGAGGTESCDWVGMLFRMYMRWAEKEGMEAQVVDMLAGEEAGIKNVTFYVRGPYAYGYLKAECGVHRLVRISPFDSNKRRHTSFASVDVIVEVEDDAEIEVKEDDLKIDTYRSSGAGGQHVNKTESAIRITHLPTGTVVQCQNERSQYKNKQMALKVLRARLYERKRKEEEEKLAQKYGEKKEIAWGSQIRSYVFHPYTLVKDHRTGFETSNGQEVMDGAIDTFIETYLRQNIKKV